MPKKSTNGRGRPPIFVRDDDGRIIYGLSSQTIIKGGRRRTRFYATFSEPRKWLGMDNLPASVQAFFEWVNANGWTPAYLSKTNQTHLIPRLNAMRQRYVKVEWRDSDSVPDWLSGRAERSCPMGQVSISDHRAFFLPMTATTLATNEAWIRRILGGQSKSLTASTKRIFAELITCLQYDLGRPQAEWVEKARRQLRDLTKLTEPRIEELLKMVSDWPSKRLDITQRSGGTPQC